MRLFHNHCVNDYEINALNVRLNNVTMKLYIFFFVLNMLVSISWKMDVHLYKMPVPQLLVCWLTLWPIGYTKFMNVTGFT